MPVERLHVGVRLTRMVDVMCAVAATGAVQTPAAVDVADPQDTAPACSLPRFEVRNPFAGVLSNLFSAWEVDGRETAFTADAGRFDCKAASEFEFHRAIFYDRMQRKLPTGGG